MVILSLVMLVALVVSFAVLAGVHHCRRLGLQMLSFHRFVSLISLDALSVELVQRHLAKA
jgi:hypothetical protein